MDEKCLEDLVNCLVRLVLCFGVDDGFAVTNLKKWIHFIIFVFFALFGKSSEIAE